MNRPKITKEMIAEAAKAVAENVDIEAEAIADLYWHPMNGYELARALDSAYSWNPTVIDVEELDCMSSIVSQLHREAEKKWAIENDIQPPLPIGTRIKEGVIEAIDAYSAARYLVKENGCTQDGCWLLVKFEDAVAV